MDQIVLKKDESPPGARQRLLNSAAELFNSKGYAATTVREIVKAAGVTKPVLYYYFRNKEGIFLELMRATYLKFNALIDSVQCGKRERSGEIGAFHRSILLSVPGRNQDREIDVFHLLWAPSGGALL